MVLPALVVIAIPAPIPAFPVAGIVTMLVIAGRDPIGTCVRWARPETGMPDKPRATRIVVTRDPRILRTRTRRRVNHNRWRGRGRVIRHPDADADRPMALGKQRTSNEHQQCEQPHLHVPRPP